MNKAEKKFLRYAVLSVFVMLTLLLGIINCINFTMAAADADAVTERIVGGHGAFSLEGDKMPQMPDVRQFERMGPMGPESPEMRSSVRFFTVAFDEDGSAEIISFHLSAISEQEAIQWAGSLIKQSKGWTRGTYRYRVYQQGDKTYVTVIDQGRELISAYRILIFSVCGTLAGTLLSYLILRLVGRKLFSPLEEADRKQKQFIAKAEQDIALPLTVISADVELLERANGSSEQTRSIHRQVRKLNGLVRKLGSLSIFDEQTLTKLPIGLSDLLQELLDRSEARFSERNITLTREIEDGVQFNGAPDAIAQALKELIENTLNYTKTNACFTLKERNGRISLSVSNDAALPDGSCDQVFDRFTVLQNAKEDATGLGLSYVKDVVRAHNGRCTASVNEGLFTLRLDF